MIKVTSDDVILMGPMPGFQKFAETYNRAVKCRITQVLEHPNGQKILEFQIEEEDQSLWINMMERGQ